MFCKKCGANIPDDEDVCPFCEEPVEGKQKEKKSEEGQEENLFPDKIIYEKKEPSFEEPSFSSIKDVEPLDRGSFWYGVLGFFLPLIGFILYLVWKNEKPNTAKQCGIGALIGFILGVVFSVGIGCCCASIDWDEVINDPNLENYVQRITF